LRILVINPNTSVEMTRTIDSVAQKYASPGTEITTISPTEGPEFIASAYHVALQASRVTELVEKNKNNYDCFVVACGADPGLEACRVVARNVIGTGESAIMAACAVAKFFSFVGPLKGEVR